MPGGRRPVIGIAPVKQREAEAMPVLISRLTYLDALTEAGAAPVVLGSLDPAMAARFAETLDGVVIPGGFDLDPGSYGETAHPAAEPLDPDLGRFYLALARAALAARVPTLGICLGCQVLNVALGGSLVQHLEEGKPGGVEHRLPGGGDRRHPVKIQPGTRLHAAMGTETADVMSYHHQAIARLGDGLRATAHAPDDVIEGIEHDSLPFFVGVQWHPERSRMEASSRHLLEAFVRAAAGAESGGGKAMA